MKYIVFLTYNVKDQIKGLNRVYVGVHETENPGVFDGYLGNGVYKQQANTFMYPKSAFQHAVKKYGVQSFERVVLYVCDTLEEAYEKEAELLNDDFTKQSHVYNTLQYKHKFKHLYQFDLHGNLIKVWNVPREASEFYGYTQSKFYYAICGKYKFLNSYWSGKDEINIEEYTEKNNQRTIYLYNLDGKLLREFNSTIECANYIGVDNITKALKTGQPIKGYYVSNKLTDLFIAKPRTAYLHETFYVYQEGKFLGKYVGKELMKAINLHSWFKISNIFKINNNWYKNYYITLEPTDDVPTVRYTANIDVYDQYGNFIENLSVRDTKEKYNIPSNKILDIKQGNKYFGNYIFKYNSK